MKFFDKFLFSLLLSCLIATACSAMEQENDTEQQEKKEQQLFDSIRLVGFESPIQLRTICYAHQELENLDPENFMNNDEVKTPEKNPSLSNSSSYETLKTSYQKVIFSILKSLSLVNPITQKAHYSFEKLKLTAILEVLQKRTTKDKFVSTHYNIIGTYNNLIETLQHDLEKKIIIHTFPETNANGDYSEVDLIKPCNQLSEKMARHYKVIGALKTFHQPAVKMVVNLIEENKKS